ncbi:hypothetical protein DOTSEDRAFT_137794 [Dothistroma septosporum NZE10]|uniref:FAD-binding FR-type domain-containing protein n=1 Tax=Dothistroma septosporum (strain NZE10 / CBS 128990) TaxID=675120 RepID=N1PCK2_DOTSN|nr:hypothetical protein DOTSEDRAFT_137794 [Dothistroma septosporum NZE10]
MIEGRQRSIYSIKAAQNSNDTDITGIDEQHLPGPAQELLQEQPPGQYTFTVTEQVGRIQKEEKAFVNVELSPLKYIDLVATKESLHTYAAAYPLPNIQGLSRITKFRYGWLTVYRRLFAIVFGANIIAIVVLACRGPHITYGAAAIGVGSNIFASILARHDNLINAVISTIHFVPLSWPLAIRRRLGKIYCHAGIHSACGTSAAVWYLYFIVLIAIQPVTDKENIQIGIFVTAGAILICLLVLIGMSHPTMRGRYHDHWENTHRYIGWLLTAIIWAQVLLLCSTSPRSFGSAVVHSPLFWLVLGVTILLIYPWAMMRKRTYIANQLSSHALRLEFPHKLSRTGHNIRLASSPLSDWHGFATIPRADATKGFSVIISNAGDWTHNIIDSASTPGEELTIHQRGRLFLGIIEIPMLFSPLVIAATGSGIAPCMAFIQTHPDWPVRIVWSARFPETTYGSGIIETVLKADKDAIIIDTKQTGRPDLLRLIWAAYKEINAEAVLCVSTMKVCEELTFELEARGVPVFTPIFDS